MSDPALRELIDDRFARFEAKPDQRLAETKEELKYGLLAILRTR